MIETLIVADDLTGANATGSLLAKQGRRVGTLMDQGNLQRNRGWLFQQTH